jgi:hypothetical protein
MEQEIRKLENEISIASGSTRNVEGYALLFNSLSTDLGGFVEKIDSNALDGVIEKSDVFATLDHNKEKGVLARSKFGKGTLQLTVDERGLKYNFEAPQTAVGDETIEMIKRGDITASSFAFTVAGDDWQLQPDGSYVRTILQIDRLYDVSPVFQPAYEQTSVNLKRFAEIQEENKKILEEQRQKELEEYYKELEKEIQ